MKAINTTSKAPKLERGSRVMVYQDPITQQIPEGLAIVSSVLSCLPWSDAAARPLYRCRVRFTDAPSADVYERDVS